MQKSRKPLPDAQYQVNCSSLSPCPLLPQEAGNGEVSAPGMLAGETLQVGGLGLRTAFKAPISHYSWDAGL